MAPHPEGAGLPEEAEIDGLELLLQGAFAAPGDAAGDADDRDDEAATPVQLPERYRLLGEVGRGGVGIVFAADDTTLSRRIAVKVLRERHRHSRVLARKFAAEGRIGAQLQHPGILGVFDIGRTGDDRPFFTMRLVPGDTLAARLALRDPEDRQLTTWLPVFARVCEAVAYAHARGVVHRDLKPGNVLLGAFGEVLVTDWGMAKLVATATVPANAFVDDEPVTATALGDGVASITGSLWGTPAYMAPEQARGAADAAAPQADVFGLGAMLCEILTGRPPYTGELEVVLVQARLCDLRDAEQRLREATVPHDLAALALRCLAVDPEARPADATEVAAAVQRHLASLQERAHEAALAAAAAEARAAADRRTRRLQAAWFTTVLVMLIVAGGAWLWSERAAHERVRRNEHAVEAALADGRARWREAVHRGDDADWRAVTAAAFQALVLVRSGDVGSEVVARAEQFAQEAEGEAAAAARRTQERAEDQALRRRLTELQSRQWLDGNVRAKEAGFAALFAELGMDPTTTAPEVVAARVRAHRLAADLAIGLDRWAGACRLLAMPSDRIAAIQTVARAVDTDPLRLSLRDLIARPDAEAARRLADTTDLRGVAPATIYLLFDAVRAAQLPEVAHEVLARGQLEHPTDFGLTSLLAQECGARGDAAGETRYAAAAMSLQPDGVQAGTRLAVNLAGAGHFQQAELLLRRLAERHADNPALWQNVGAALLSQGRFEEAIAAVQRTEQANAGDSRSALVLGRCERARKRFDEAKRWFAIAAEREPGNHDAWVSLGAMLCDDLRDYPAALIAFDRALQLAPNADDAMRNRAVVLEYLGRREEALEQWERFAEAFPDRAEPHQKMAVAAFNEQRQLAAIDHALEAVSRSPNLADAWYLFGSSLLGLEETNGGIAALRCAVRANPGHGSAWHDLGWALVDMPGRRPEAVAALRRAVVLLPHSAMANYNLAYALFGEGQFEDCRQALDTALRLEPGMARALQLRASLPAR